MMAMWMTGTTWIGVLRHCILLLRDKPNGGLQSVSCILILWQNTHIFSSGMKTLEFKISLFKVISLLLRKKAWRYRSLHLIHGDQRSTIIKLRLDKLERRCTGDTMVQAKEQNAMKTV
uniref:Uncharacterized protein n=1 Tax=Opuntia streptacantha TaxID=393608 RepID=A0A7C9EYA8_OPUST